jgi:glucuronate isomerase
MNHELYHVFGVRQALNHDTAADIYDEITEKLAKPEFKPRALFESFKLEVLSTTDAASDKLLHHQKIKESGWKGKVIPTFRPDGVVNLDAPNWRKNVDDLSDASGISVHDVDTLIKALEQRRAYFIKMGAKATDHAALTAYTGELSKTDANEIFQRALKGGEITRADVEKFTGHMLMEMARMSIEDGLVMQIHVGSFRNHNAQIYDKFGLDKGCDIPVSSEFTRNMKPLLNKYCNDTRLGLLLFTLDESVYARELSPLAGHYPSVKIGPPWWFHDSLSGMGRYFDQMMETAGIYNTAGFNDDTRAFPSIPARHDTWRRASSNWLAGMELRGLITHDEALEMSLDLAYRLPKKAYRLE